MKSSHKKLSYFQPDEMFFVIHHESDQPLEDQDIDSLIGWCNEHKTDDKLEILRLRERELHFPGTKNLKPPEQNISLPEEINYTSPALEPRGAFSIVPANVRIVDEHKNKNNPDGHVNTSDLAQLILHLDEIRNRDDQPLRSGGITIEAISPNWLATPTYEHGGGGGPGARPVPFKDSNANVPYEFQLPENIEKLCPKDKVDRGAGVKVAILDTAPCLHELAEAYERHHPVDPVNQGDRHPLIERLLKPNGPLTVHPASYEELLRMRSVYLKDHEYKMTDHGLFIAGIIHTIAPAAEIHLYEVLNPNGVGDIVSIARGLWKAVEDHYHTYKTTGEIKPLVVNCSLMLNIPLDGDPENPNSAKIIYSNASQKVTGHRLTDLDQEFLEKIKSDSDWVKRAGAGIMWICNLIYGCGSRVIAAAGNDWQPEDKGRPQARYPAAFEKVLGVGALPKEVVRTQNGKRKASSYSNIADIPGRVGVATLGGEPGKERGVLGVYLGKFPPEQSAAPINTSGLDNENDWAWWAGTSFATPIVTGAVAAVLSGPSHPATTEVAIVRMYENGVIVNNQTDFEEDLLDVKQGTDSN